MAHVDLDELATGPGWRDISDHEFRERVQAVLDTPGWIIDGDHRIREDVELAHGNRLSWNAGLLRWLAHEVRSHLRRRMRMRSRLARHQKLQVVHLRSQPAVDAWLAEELRGRTDPA